VTDAGGSRHRRPGKGLRIAVATARFRPYTGGIETHVLEVGRRLVARGHAVTVLTADPAGAWAATDDVDGIEVRRFPARPRRGEDLSLGDRVQFRSHGPDERAELGAVVAGAGAMALLSDYEAHPVAVLEALSVGTPVLGWDCAALADLLHGGRRQQPVALPTWADCTDAVEEVLLRAAGERPR
jgi:glycosyltransferase involved in cell wall biosynthesis